MENNKKASDSVLQGLSLMLVDDNPCSMRSLASVLRNRGASVSGLGSLRQAHRSLRCRPYDGVVSNFQLKDGIGTELLPDYQARCPKGGFYLITRQDDCVFNAKEARLQGVRDCFEKPVDPNALTERLAVDLNPRSPNDRLAEQLAPYLLIQDPVMAEALSDLPRFAATHEPVLIYGETGTGKELAAKAIHGLGPRAKAPFVTVNCGAIPETLLEAELFGYEKGAFTGASRRHKGRFEQAHQGTLFLDEIGEMPPQAQVSLLRILEENRVQPIGAEYDVPVDVRVVAATHRSLEEHVKAGLFRQDLFYRLLAGHFLGNSLKDINWQSTTPSLSADALAILQNHPWSGNVRELRNLMARLAVRLPEGAGEIDPNLLRPLLFPILASSPSSQGGIFIPKGTTLANAEWLLIEAALKQSGYNRTQAAKLLGMGERTLRRRLNEA
jgi:DNA-binding NtrC family response regulator